MLFIKTSFENNPTKLGSKIGELKVKFDKARTNLSATPGIDMSHTEQIEYYQTLLKQYKNDNELLNSYKEMCDFDISRLEQQPTISSTVKDENTNSLVSNESENLTKENME